MGTKRILTTNQLVKVSRETLFWYHEQKGWSLDQAHLANEVLMLAGFFKTPFLLLVSLECAITLECSSWIDFIIICIVQQKRLEDEPLALKGWSRLFTHALWNRMRTVPPELSEWLHMLHRPMWNSPYYRSSFVEREQRILQELYRAPSRPLTLESILTTIHRNKTRVFFLSLTHAWPDWSSALGRWKPLLVH
jgi:hypothetical protein